MSHNSKLHYDATGNIIQDEKHTYSYDARNRLIAIDNNVTYQYNYDNKRVSKTVNGVTTYFIYDGHKLLGEYDQNGDLIKEYVYYNATPIAIIEKIYADHLDTPRRVADNSNNIIWKWESSPFGETKPTGSYTLNLRFPGQYFDTETGTHYNINRDYNPVTGRYIQSDPIGFDGGVNGYLYVGGKPIMLSDLMGLWASKSGFYVHQDANERVLGRYLGVNGIDILNKATDVVDGSIEQQVWEVIDYHWGDSAYNQKGWMSYKHAMRGLYKKGGALMSISEARAKSNLWIRRLYALAWYYEDSGNMDEALFYFGRALHTLQDETSPAHTGFQVWDGSENWIDIGIHASKELFEWQTRGTRLGKRGTVIMITLPSYLRSPCK